MIEETTPPAGRLLRNGLGFIERLLLALFSYPKDRRGWLINGLGLAGLFFGGVWLWGVFFNWGNISFDFLDWGEVTGPRYALLRDAAQKGILPLHASNLTALRGVTDRYFSIADTPFSPQYLFLRYLNPGQYIFFDTLLFYTIGFIGLVLIFRRYRLSMFAFAILFIIFNFNGNLTAHLAVGHTIWNAQFLLPFFILLVIDLLDKEKASWSWILGLCVVELAILLQGFFHLYFWCLLFLGILVLINWRLFKPVFLGVLFVVLITLPRLLPPTLVVSKITNLFLGGFASVTDLFAGMMILRDPDRTVGEISDTFRLNAWEIDFYIGLLGLALIILFGVIIPILLRTSKKTIETQVLVASFIFCALSIGKVYAFFLRFVPIPPFTAERVTARMFIIPLVFVLVLAVVTLQRELSKRSFPAGMYLLFLALAGLLYHDIHQHLQAWRIRYLDGLVYLYPKIPFNPAEHTIANHPDPLYTGVMAGGLILAVVVLGFVIFRALREPSGSIGTAVLAEDPTRLF